MGILVEGAERVEAGVEDLKRHLRIITEETRAGVNGDQRLGTAWQELTRSHFRSAIRKVEPYNVRMRHETKALLNRAEVRARRALKGTIIRTIDELEKLKRKLDDDSSRGWYAA